MNYPIKSILAPALLIAVAGVAALYVLQQLAFPDGESSMFSRIVWGNAISPVIIGIFLTAMFLLVSKRRKLKKEKNTSSRFLREVAPRLIDHNTRLEDIASQSDYQHNLLAYRWQQAQVQGHQPDSSRTFSESEQEHLQNSYSLIRFFVWALPIVGFIGTVWGIGLSISFFSETMSASQAGGSVSALLQQNIPLVTKGLSTAFDTTFLALILSLPATAFLIVTERDEREYLLQLDEQWRAFTANQYDATAELATPEQAEFAHAQAVGESLRDLREEAFDLHQHQYRD